MYLKIFILFALFENNFECDKKHHNKSKRKNVKIYEHYIIYLSFLVGLLHNYSHQFITEA